MLIQNTLHFRSPYLHHAWKPVSPLIEDAVVDITDISLNLCTFLISLDISSSVCTISSLCANN
jgi:hypothetical protein